MVVFNQIISYCTVAVLLISENGSATKTYSTTIRIVTEL